MLTLVSRTSGQSGNQLVYVPMIVSPPSPTTLVSVDSDEIQANSVSGSPSVSADGRYVAFASDASNLVVDDTNGVRDIFVRDRQTSQTTRVSISSNGMEANNESNIPFIASDGRYIVFQSNASNLVANDTNATEDIFVHDQQTGETTRASVDSNGTQANGRSFDGSISADGRYIAFGSFAINLVAGQDLFSDPDVFVHDRQTGQTRRLSQDGANGIGAFYGPVISANGRYVTFYSDLATYIPGDTNNAADIFVYDLQLDTKSRASLSSNGTEADSNSSEPSISADGRYVAFESYATNLVANDTNNGIDIFVHDRQTGATTRVSVATGGIQTGGDMGAAAISGSGRYVAFTAVASDIVPGDGNNTLDVFVHDRNTNVTTLISVTPNGESGNQFSYGAAISAEGRYVSFVSEADNLVSDDMNFARDVFIRDWQIGNN
jgi:Tol biopolymer transport system component